MHLAGEVWKRQVLDAKRLPMLVPSVQGHGSSETWGTALDQEKTQTSAACWGHEGGHFHSGRFPPGQKVLQNWIWFGLVVTGYGGGGRWVVAGRVGWEPSPTWLDRLAPTCGNGLVTSALHKTVGVYVPWRGAAFWPPTYSNAISK